MTAVLYYHWLAAGLHDKIISQGVGGHRVYVGIRHPLSHSHIQLCTNSPRRSKKKTSLSLGRLHTCDYDVINPWCSQLQTIQYCAHFLYENLQLDVVHLWSNDVFFPLAFHINLKTFLSSKVYSCSLGRAHWTWIFSRNEPLVVYFFRSFVHLKEAKPNITMNTVTDSRNSVENCHSLSSCGKNKKRHIYSIAQYCLLRWLHRVIIYPMGYKFNTKKVRFVEQFSLFLQMYEELIL